MYKVLILNWFPTLQTNLNLQYPTHSYGTRNHCDPITVFPRVCSVRLSFKYQSVNIWNDLPENIKKLKYDDILSHNFNYPLKLAQIDST